MKILLAVFVAFMFNGCMAKKWHPPSKVPKVECNEECQKEKEKEKKKDEYKTAD